MRIGWEQLFAGDTRLAFRLEQVVMIETVGLAMQSAVEQITVGKDGGSTGTAVCTNIFLRTPLRLADGDASRVDRPGGTLYCPVRPSALEGELAFVERRQTLERPAPALNVTRTRGARAKTQPTDPMIIR